MKVAERPTMASGKSGRGASQRAVAAPGRTPRRRQGTMPEFVAALIGGLVREALRKGIVRHQDGEDLAQELAAHYLLRAIRLDRTKAASGAFVHRLLERRLASWLRDRGAAKRGRNKTAPLRSEEEAAAPDPSERRLLAADVAAVLAKLPPHQRELAVLLMDRSKSQAARERGVPRTTQERQVQALRRRFERAGLAGCL